MISNDYLPLLGLGIFVFFVGGIGLLAKWAEAEKARRDAEERRRALEK